MPDPTTTLFAEIDRHFLAPEALKRAALLGRVGPDAGGWFKAELAYLLDTLLKAGRIKAWRANAPFTGRLRRAGLPLARGQVLAS